MAANAPRDSVVPLAWWISFCHAAWVAAAALVFRIAARFGADPKSRSRRRSPLLCIEGGSAGWEIIELIELASSAEEYLGAGCVHRIVVQSRDEYKQTVRKGMDSVRPTHYLYDPRTGSQHWFYGPWEALVVGFMAARRDVIPIGWLTDLPIRRWRLQVAIVTAVTGVTITLMNASQVAGMFPHRRLTGPSMMPLSEATLELLESLRSAHDEAAATDSLPRAIFSGSLYEPRTSSLIAIRDGLRANGLDLEILSRELGGPRVPNDTYWKRLTDADIVVTTADQVFGPGIDETGLPHLIYRYTEALAAGALLIAPSVPAVERFFEPGKHFIPFDSTKTAVALIAYYLENHELRRRIARQGHARVAQLIRARACWLTIDAALGTESMI